MQKSRFRNLHDVNEYFKSERLEPTTWPKFHTPCSEPEVTHLLHSITVSVHLLLLLFLYSIESHLNPPNPISDPIYGLILNLYLIHWCAKKWHLCKKMTPVAKKMTPVAKKMSPVAKKMTPLRKSNSHNIKLYDFYLNIIYLILIYL